MRSILFALALLCFNLLSAQDTLKLAVDNPGPRVGDEVELSFSFDFFSDHLKSQLNSEVEMKSSLSAFGSNSDKLIRRIEFTKQGKRTIGPFKFGFNGKTLTTDSISFDVAEKLPFEEGVWIRLISDYQDNKLLIVEQLVKNESDYSDNKNGFSYTIGGKMDEKTELVEIEEVSENGLEITFRSSKSKTRTKDGGDTYAAGLTYSFKKYQIEFDESFDGPFTLKKKHLINLPKKTSFDNIVISR